jgi:predicted phage terminase large subunit-like protein
MSVDLKLQAIAVEREKRRRGIRTARPTSFREFIPAAWHVVEPAIPFVPNWHVDAIGDHLDAIVRGEITRLVINIPPGHMKSLTVSALWPPWVWVDRPDWRFLCGSYGIELAIRDAVKSRDVIDSEWYRDTFAPTWSLSTDQNVKSYYKNTCKGERIAVSVGGKTTGFRGNVVIIDDPLSVMDSYSQAKREEAVRWLDQAATNRLNDPRTGAVVIMMQRVHENDPTGHVLKQGGYEHLCLPTEFESARRTVTSIGWTDPRTEEGQLLFPQMYTPEVLAGEKRRLGPFGYAGQHQQRPVPQEGAMFKTAALTTRDANGVAHAIPRAPGTRWVRFWDIGGAGKRTQSDNTVGFLMAGTPDGRYHLVDVERGKWSADERNALIRRVGFADQERFGYVPQKIERGIGMGGEATARIVRDCAGLPIEEVSARGDKVTRADPFAAQVNSGNVAMIEAPWNREFIEELASFPFVDHDDQVDAASGAFAFLAGGNSVWVDL